jgi:citrate lyase subunit beta/citryl-CoA lyase
VDAVILDLEDAVAPDAKADARAAAVAAVKEGGFGDREVAIRVNGSDTPWGADDLAAVATSGANAILVPKVSSPGDIQAYHEALSAAPSTTQLWAMIETCAAVGQLDAIAAMSASTRLSLFVMGTNDLGKEMHARMTPERTPFLPIFALTICAARAHGIAVLDGVCNEFRDIAFFRAETEQSQIFGFDGKTLIHPDQVLPCNEIFSPSAKELGWAQAVIDAFALPENAGKGVITVGGKMTELLHLDQAKKLIIVAEKIAAQR